MFDELSYDPATAQSAPTVEPLTALRRFGPAAVCVGSVLLANTWNPGNHGPTLCPWRAATGSWCPGCGLTRAVLALGRADWSTATRYHPWVWLLAAQFPVFAVVRMFAMSGGVAMVFLGKAWQWLLLFNAFGLLFLWAFRMQSGAIPIVGG